MYPIEELDSIRDVIRYTFTCFAKSEIYYGHGTDNPYDEAVQLVLSELALPWDTPEAMWAAKLTRAEKQQLADKIAKRIEHRVPLAYLTQRAWFCGEEYYVDERVLVPRSPIAELIEHGFSPWLAEQTPARILDLCTGSGCIGLACAQRFPEARVDLLDISADALAVAEINVAKLDLADRVSLRRSDVFSVYTEASSEQVQFDLIVSNPPYVDAEDMASMPPEYRKEPELGLTAGDDGLAIVRRILAGAGELLTARGLLVVEVGNSGVALEQAFPHVPFTWVEFERGGHGVFVMTRDELIGYEW